jgi:manganese-dependent inorganic pyrophosphatase
MAKTYIIGHAKPDTDAVVAAIAFKHLCEHAECFAHPETEAVIADPLNPETSYLFEKYNQAVPRLISSSDISADDKVILVDHNEATQRMPGIAEDQIVEIIDHHKVNLNLNNPIFLTFKAWGSSSTIVYYLMKQQQVVPDQKLAALMLCAILSDTVGFKSSTTTQKDKDMGAELAQLAGVSDVAALTLEIFKAKSNIAVLSDVQIVKNDAKVFDFSKKTFIDQLETVEQDFIITSKKTGLLTAMQQVKELEGVELLFVAITDILNVNTKLLILSDAEAQVAEKAFGGKTIDNILDIGPKMSRKKDIAPAIEKALS